MLRHVSALTVGHIQENQHVQVTYNFKKTKESYWNLQDPWRWPTVKVETWRSIN